ncbi:uncharacterized protein LOC112184315 [Rosa chinensis]|uniref:uncharacterized protein LOC112184315 n=1 Tax=Rosa chinensis TaxID=74649 RepID=UPI000D08D138|nr:uncharacterized protein LOC112184315 [Rosa chinensis]
MNYEKIHVCPNDCILYRDSNVDATSCPTCGLSRWKFGKNKVEKVGVPGKVLWYFPPIPRFRKMFQSTSTAKSLTWHADERLKDDKMRHPADSPTWKLVDDKWPAFSSEPRNLRLALSSDGFNPHSSLSSRYSCWPVILVTYNLPPWLCMKRKYMMLTLLISGPKQPGNDIDVYLQPLIDDLKILWDGVEGVYDGYRKKYFKLKAVLFWTINDFPTYGNLSGSIVKGYNACPVCLQHTKPHRLAHGQKMSYMRHRRFLPRYHPYRKQAAVFDNTEERDLAPIPLSGHEVLQRVEGMNWPFGKKHPHPPYKGAEDESRPCWKKKSVFFELEYWKFLPVRHNLDVMHIEKNVCDALIGTLLNIPGKTKDGVAARLDMVAMGIRAGLKPKIGGEKEKLPLASWNLMLEEKKTVCKSFFGMKLADRLCSNVKSLVSMDDLRLVGMKSHDCHTVLHHLLPIAIRSVLEKPVRYAIIKFCLFFKAICSKLIDVEKLKKIQADLVETVCELEKFFPPSFFDIMIHLSIHLVREVELCGPIFFRWMYPFERYMKTLKGYVRNRNHPEGCIVESYIAEEAVEFLAERNLTEPIVGLQSSSTSDQKGTCRPMSGATMICPNQKKLQLAHLCVLQNTNEARPYFDEHLEWLKHVHPNFKKNKKWLKEKQNKTFAKWIQDKVAAGCIDDHINVSEHLRWIADGPSSEVPTFSAYKINGVNFNTKDRDDVRAVQCSGVSLFANAMLISSAKDKNPVNDDTTFYGVVKDIWELDYHSFRVPVFYYDWVDIDKSIKIDDLGYTLVNLNKLGHFNDPFVLGTDVKQVCYIDDPLNANWSVVVRCPDRDYHAGDDEEVGVIELENELFDTTMPSIDTTDVDGDQTSNYMRDGDEGIWID